MTNVAQQVGRSSCACAVSLEPPGDWPKYLAAAGAGIFHDPRWGMAMNEAYRNQHLYLTARRGAEIAGVLQLVLQKSRLLGSRLCSLPYLDASGIVAADSQAADALLEAAHRMMAEHRARWVELRHEQPLGQLPCRTDKVTLRLALPGTQEELFARVGAKNRNQVRKSQSYNPTFHGGHSELLDEFYAIYLRTMRDLGSPPHSRRFFDILLDMFGDTARLYIVRGGSGPLAAAFALRQSSLAGRPGRLYVPWAGSDWRYRNQLANTFLYWSMFLDAQNQGFGEFDFGRSTVGGGTYHFKLKWGAAPVPLYWQYLLPAGRSLPPTTSQNSSFQLAQRCWRHLPLGLARLLGPRIISRLS